MVVPVLTAVTRPLDGSTVATEVLLLLHVPPIVESERAVKEEVQMLVIPVIGDNPTYTIILEAQNEVL